MVLYQLLISVLLEVSVLLLYNVHYTLGRLNKQKLMLIEPRKKKQENETNMFFLLSVAGCRLRWQHLHD